MLSRISREAFSQVRVVPTAHRTGLDRMREDIQTGRLERCYVRIIHATEFLRDSRASDHIWRRVLEIRELSLSNLRR